MAGRGRFWDRLGESQRKRYLGYGRKRGMSAAEVRAHYEAGGSLQGWTGKGGTGRVRNWAGLSDRQRKRYLGFGKKRGLTPAEVESYYRSGGDLSEYRGRHAGPREVSDSTWRRLLQAARESGLERGGVAPELVLAGLLEKGYSPDWILERLHEQRESRDEYFTEWRTLMRRYNLDEGFQPGRARFHRRDISADIEIYYYH